jgi:hypothetical protein
MTDLLGARVCGPTGSGASRQFRRRTLLNFPQRADKDVSPKQVAARFLGRLKTRHHDWIPTLCSFDAPDATTMRRIQWSRSDRQALGAMAATVFGQTFAFSCPTRRHGVAEVSMYYGVPVAYFDRWKPYIGQPPA